MTKNVLPLTLPPQIHGDIGRYLEDQPGLYALMDAFGSPLNLVFPDVLKSNIDGFKKVFEQHKLKGQIFFTTKPNKSRAILSQAALEKVGVDVSSERGLSQALACGVHPQRIECTGPKNIPYLMLALQQGVTVNVDNENELRQIFDLHRILELNSPVRVFIRLSGFHSSRQRYTPQDNTFGVHVDRAVEVIEYLHDNRNTFNFLGFSFHFRAMGRDHKALAIEQCLQLTFAAMEKGLKPQGLNIGGGFDIQYARSAQEWGTFVEKLKSSILESVETLSWNNAGLGYRNEDGTLKGAPNFVQHYMETAGADDLDEILKHQLPAFDGATVAEVMLDCMLEMFIEPGRALLDQMGVTVAKVMHVKPSTQGHVLVGLDMNRSSLHSTQQKLLTDPIVISRRKNFSPCPQGVFYTGNLCLSHDMITYSKSFPPFMPEEGDLVVFINTAAYLMDFAESETLHQRTASKIAIVNRNDTFHWYQDDLYNAAVRVYEDKTYDC